MLSYLVITHKGSHHWLIVPFTDVMFHGFHHHGCQHLEVIKSNHLLDSEPTIAVNLPHHFALL
jgi:hypothetical protein